MTKWMKLTRGDLRAFDDKATELILEAMERGAVGRISTKGHCILRAPTGATMSVSRNTGSGNRGRYNMEAEFARIFGTVEVRALPRAVGDNEPAHPLIPRQGQPMLPCPADWCDREFVTGGARYTHVQRDHFPCKEPGCDRVFDEARKASGHYNVVHHRAALAKEPAECEYCDWTGTQAGKGSHVGRAHPTKTKKALAARKKAAKKSPPKAPSSDSPKAVPVKGDAAETLARVRAVLGADPRVAELEAEVAALRKHNAELEARLTLLKEALDA